MRNDRPMSVRAARLAAAAAAFIATVTVAAAPARADDGLASSAPAAGTVIGAPPPVVTLRLDQPVRQASAVVTDGCGRRVPGGVTVAGSRVSVRLAIDDVGITAQDHSMAAGFWRVGWQAVHPDGTRTSGELPFTVGGRARCHELPRPLGGGHGAVAGHGGAALSGQSPVGRGVTGSVIPLGPLLAVAGIGVLLAFVQLLVRRRGSRPPAEPVAVRAEIAGSPGGSAGRTGAPAGPAH